MSFYDKILFRVKILNVKEILKILNMREQNVEYVYISHNTTIKLKFIDDKIIVQQID